jgi:hypothetical protein
MSRPPALVLKEEIAAPEASVIISRAPCVLLPEEVKRKKPVYFTNLDNCTGCGALRADGLSGHQLDAVDAGGGDGARLS